MQWYFVILKCEVENKRHRVPRYFVKLKCEVKQKTPRASVFVILTCEVKKKTHTCCGTVTVLSCITVLSRDSDTAHHHVKTS